MNLFPHRPKRLTDATRAFAARALSCEFGRDTRANNAVSLDDIPGFPSLSPLRQYDLAIESIVAHSRIRIMDGELLTGSADFGMAISHRIPATYQGNPVFSSGVSHLTVDFRTILTRGMNGIESDIQTRLTDATLTDRQRDFLESCQHSVDSMRCWHRRYLDKLRNLPEFLINFKNLTNVPFSPATTFHEAVQSIWFCFAFLRLCGNWPGIGRIDELLGGYLRKDLADGTTTLNDAREILAHFFIKGCEWICGGNYGSGDAQHYQNLILAGIDADGREVENEVTHLVLDIIEELGISDYPTTVRLNRHSSDHLLHRTAEVMKQGGGILAVYNEDNIINSLTTHGYSLREARTFTNDGCWEIQIPGKTYFTYFPIDALSLLLNDTLHLSDTWDIPAHFDSYTDLRAAFFRNMDKKLAAMYRDSLDRGTGSVPGWDWHWSRDLPCAVVSLFEPNCIRTARSYLDGGTEYWVVSPHLGGAADAGNSLYILDKLCFTDNLLPLDEFLQILKNNWEGREDLRRRIRDKYPLYGNDEDTADRYTVDVADTFAELVLKRKNLSEILFVPGISTFGREIGWRHHRPAAPHGSHHGDVLAPNFSPTPGTDLAGATAKIRSYCKANLKNQVTGAALDLKLHPSAVQGEAGTYALAALLRAFVELDGCFLQPDIVDPETLRRAQEEPEAYASLSVRVSGWNARFVTLDREWQEMCIRNFGGKPYLDKNPSV